MKKATVDEFKGNKILKIPMDETNTRFFSFGLRKAELILENLDDIKEFVDEYKKDE